MLTAKEALDLQKQALRKYAEDRAAPYMAAAEDRIKMACAAGRTGVNLFVGDIACVSDRIALASVLGDRGYQVQISGTEWHISWDEAI